MKREVIALLLLSLLLLPMFAGVRRLKSLPKQRTPEDATPPALPRDADEGAVQEKGR